jgi:hypothetical protein
MKKFKPWLVIILVFCAGFAGGVAVTRGVIRHIVRQVINNPDFMRDKIERRLAVRLRLDHDQREKVHDVLVHTQQEMKSLREDFQPRFFSIMSQAQSEISATLTPEQRRKFEEFQDENRQLWQKR